MSTPTVLPSSYVLRRGLELIGIPVQKQQRQCYFSRLRRFRQNYGSHPKVYASLWEKLQRTTCWEANILSFVKERDFDNFLMAVFWLKRYPVEEDMAARFGCHEQTARKWVEYFVTKIAALKPDLIKWPETFGDVVFIVSVDCVNFGVNEPRHKTLHKDKKMFDRKGGKAGYTYEIALHLWESKIVWASDPFKPNDGGDAAIYQTEGGLMHTISEGKKAIADKIYKGLPKIALHNLFDYERVRKFKGRARARQESINARLKSFHCLKQRF